jgi:transcriptional regulator with XRE-family HTH domain
MTDGPILGGTVPLAEILSEFSTEDRSEIRRHADHLIQESRTIAQFRRETGMTQAELAAALETSQAYVAKLEGKPAADMQASTIARIAEALGGQVKVVVSLPGKPDAILAMPTFVRRKKATRAKAEGGVTLKSRLASA